MLVKKIILHHWKTHLHTELEFEGGVNAIVGIMGSGKSSVLDALTFALFGTFPALQQRKLKIDNIIMMYPQEKKDAYVAVEFYDNYSGKTYYVKRSIEVKRGTTDCELRCDGSLVDASSSQRITEHVQNILKVDFDLFSQVIYCEQNRIDQFIQIPRGKRMEKIDELLKINRFESARSNSVKLANRLKQRLSIRMADIERLSKDIASKDIESLKKSINALVDELESLEKSLAETESKKGETSRHLEKLRKKKLLFDKYKERELILSGKIEQISAQLGRYEKMPDAQNIKDFTIDFIDIQLERLKSAFAKQQAVGNDVIRLRQNISNTEAQRVEFKKKLDELSKQKEEYQKISKVESEIKNADEAKNELLNRIAKNNAIISEETESLKTLFSSDANCPVCDTRLDPDKKKSLIEIKKDIIKTAQSKFSEQESELKLLSSKISALDTERKKLMLLSHCNEDIKYFESKKNLLDDSEKDTRKKLEDISKDYSEDKMKKIDEEISKFKNIRQILELTSSKSEFEEARKQIRIDIEELGFDPHELEKCESLENALDSQYKVGKQKYISTKSLHDEKTRHLKDIEKLVDTLDSYRKETEAIESSEVQLLAFKNIIEETQVALREQFIESINFAMNSFWKLLYPYGDYTEIRLEVENDYLLQLKNTDGAWVSVEGSVSGGERMMAVLVLRLAMSLILAPNIKWLLLDEPTHNLDRNAVEQISEAFRSDVGKLIDQIIIITHDEALESSVTGKLYRLDRGEKKEDVTKAVAI